MHYNFFKLSSEMSAIEMCKVRGNDAVLLYFYECLSCESAKLIKTCPMSYCVGALITIS